MSEVLQSLNIDKSFFTQFAIVVFLFVFLKNFLFDKLLSVITSREENTTGLLNTSRDKEDKSKSISTEIDNQISQCKNQIIKENKRIREEATSQKEKEYALAESKLSEEYSTKINDFSAGLEKNYELVKKDTSSLAGELVNKITH